MDGKLVPFGRARLRRERERQKEKRFLTVKERDGGC